MCSSICKVKPLFERGNFKDKYTDAFRWAFFVSDFSGLSAFTV